MHANGLLITDSLFYVRTMPFIILTMLSVLMLRVLTKRIGLRKAKVVYSVLFCVYIIAILYLTVFSRKQEVRHPFDFNPFTALSRTFRIVEGQLQYASRDSIIELVLNIVLFVPFGFLLSGIRYCRCSWRRILLAGAVSSGLIEVLQFCWSLGTGEMADIINNTIGVGIGAGLFELLVHRQDF